METPPLPQNLQTGPEPDQADAGPAVEVVTDTSLQAVGVPQEPGDTDPETSAEEAPPPGEPAVEEEPDQADAGPAVEAVTDTSLQAVGVPQEPGDTDPETSAEEAPPPGELAIEEEPDQAGAGPVVEAVPDISLQAGGVPQERGDTDPETSVEEAPLPGEPAIEEEPDQAGAGPVVEAVPDISLQAGGVPQERGDAAPETSVEEAPLPGEPAVEEEPEKPLAEMMSALCLEVSALREEVRSLREVVGIAHESRNQPASLPADTLPGELPELPDLAPLIAEAHQEQEEVLNKDRADLIGYMSELRKWNHNVTQMRQDICCATEKGAAIFAEGQAECDSMPSVSRERLHGSQESLNILGKMLARLQERTPKENEEPKSSLPVVGEREWASLLEGETTEESIRKKIRAKLKLLGNERYQVLAQTRNAAENTRKSFFTFVEKQVLPVLDGLDDGERHSLPLVNELKTSHPELIPALDSWLRAYEGLRNLLLDMLARFGVRRMAVETGAMIDYSRHEPFEIEPDPALENEQIKSVVRNGYEYKTENEELNYVLRPAQVIVAKN